MSRKRLGPSSPDGLRMPVVGAPLLESGECMDPPVAEHGLSLIDFRDVGGRRAGPCSSTRVRPSAPWRTICAP